MSKERSAYITRTEDFAGFIETVNGKKTLRINSPTFYQHQINKLKDGEKVSIYLSTKKPKRSEQQNRYYWGVYLPIISSETGEKDLQALHNLFRGKFLTTAIVEVLGEKVRLARSTTDLSVSEFIEYIMSIEALTGIEAPPTENYFSSK